MTSKVLCWTHCVLVLLQVILGFGVVEGDQCAASLADHMCSIPDTLSAQTQKCGISYGFCRGDSKPSTSCEVEGATANATVITADYEIKKGTVAKYDCKDESGWVSGDKRRTCGAGRELGGSSLKCFGGCPSGKDWLYLPSSQLCYKYFHPKQPFLRAVAKCESMGCQLAMPKTKEENEIVLKARTVSTTKPARAKIGKSWIGLENIQYALKKRPEMEWRDGEVLSGWSKEQVIKGEKYGCTAMIGVHWTRRKCSEKFGMPRHSYVCQCPLKDAREKILPNPVWINPATPFITPIPKPGDCTVHIEGVAGLNETASFYSFYLKFWADYFNKKDKKVQQTLVVSFRPKTDKIAVNNKINAKWGTEPSLGRDNVAKYPFTEGQTFKISVAMETKLYKVTVNGTPLLNNPDYTNFNYNNKYALPATYMTFVGEAKLTKLYFT